jgi:hypothetical protein
MKNSMFILVLGVLFSASVSAAPRTFVAASNGNDGNPCSRPLPCRSFSAAIVQTDPAGEVIALDSGGYGVVTISQSVSLIAPAGVYAGITSTAGDGVIVNAGTGRVVLRNLTLKSAVMAANSGIHADSVGVLSVEGCTISGFDYGIFFASATTTASLHVRDTAVANSSTMGISITGGMGMQATIDSVRLQQNATGVYVSNAEATIRTSVTSGIGNPGFWASTGSKVVIEESVATRHTTGFYASGGGVMIMTRSAATSNGSTGVSAGDAGSTIYVSDCTIAQNDIGVLPFLGGIIKTRGNNTLQANTTDGAFSGGFTAQ